MAWSTREIAELAGTTVNTIRHYHRLGLLDEPERRYNGYKQYGIPDLVRLLRIRRLTELGVPLAQIDMVGAGKEGTPGVLHELDAHLAAGIERLQKARADIAAILRDGAPADAPPGFESVAAGLSEADSSMIHLYTQLYDEEALADVQRMVAADTDALAREIDLLPGEAGEEVRQLLAERLAPTLAQNLVDYPWLRDPASRLSRSGDVADQMFRDAVTELYNPAQLDVLLRASLLAFQQLNSVDESNG